MRRHTFIVTSIVFSLVGFVIIVQLPPCDCWQPGKSSVSLCLFVFLFLCFFSSNILLLFFTKFTFLGEKNSLDWLSTDSWRDLFCTVLSGTSLKGGYCCSGEKRFPVANGPLMSRSFCLNCKTKWPHLYKGTWVLL